MKFGSWVVKSYWFIKYYRIFILDFIHNDISHSYLRRRAVFRTKVIKNRIWFFINYKFFLQHSKSKLCSWLKLVCYYVIVKYQWHFKIEVQMYTILNLDFRQKEKKKNFLVLIKCSSLNMFYRITNDKKILLEGQF